MDPFKLQRSILRTIMADRPSTPKGMASTLDRLTSAPHGRIWATCQSIDWSRGERRWVRWFKALLKQHPIPAATELLWFEVPSELNPAFTSVSAYEKLGPEKECYGLNEGRTWPQNRKGFTLPAGLHDLPELESAFRRVKWGRTSGENDEVLLPHVFANSFAYAVLLVLNGLPQTKVLARLTVPDVAAIAGWAEGDAYPIGQLTAEGWVPIRKVRATPRPPTPEE